MLEKEECGGKIRSRDGEDRGEGGVESGGRDEGSGGEEVTQRPPGR
jgi:hypothetical protein